MIIFIRRLIRNKPILFPLVLILLYLCWEIVYSTWLINSRFSGYLCELLGRSAGFVFSIAGYETGWNNFVLYLDNKPAVNIGVPCNGLDFAGLIVCFVLAFPAPVKEKLLFLPLSLLVIHLINTFRVIFLIGNYLYFSNSFEFNHKYTFAVVVYGVMLVMWVLWARKMRDKYGFEAV